MFLLIFIKTNFVFKVAIFHILFDLLNESVLYGLQLFPFLAGLSFELFKHVSEVLEIPKQIKHHDLLCLIDIRTKCYVVVALLGQYLYPQFLNIQLL